MRLFCVAVAVMAAVTLAACDGTTAPPIGPPSAGSGFPMQPLHDGDLLISDGTPMVIIGGQRVTFPTAVLDAAWSPDGSRIAFVDGSGNIATARPDGSSLIVLTTPRGGVIRRRPTWYPRLASILFDERTGSDDWRVMGVSASGSGGGVADGEYELGALFPGGPATGNHGASASGVTGAGREIAFEHTIGPDSEVWVADTDGEPRGRRAATGTDVALSPDGGHIAYVANGQINVLSLASTSAKPIQVTFGAASPSRLAWRPDGRRIAYSTADGVASVAASVPAGARSNPITVESPRTGVPSYLPPSTDTVARLPGRDAVALAVSASRTTYARGSATGVTLVATGRAEAVLALGRQSSGPLLLTDGALLDPRTRDELRRVLGDNRAAEVVLVGDLSLITAGVEQAVRAMGYRTRRIAGHDAVSLVDTAIARTNPATLTKLAIVSADHFDELALSPALASPGGVLVAVDGHLPPTAQALLNRVGSDVPVYTLDPLAQRAAMEPWEGKRVSFSPIQVPGVGPVLDHHAAAFTGLVVLDDASAAEIAVALDFARQHNAIVVAYDIDQDIDRKVYSWLDHSSGTVGLVVLLDPNNAIPPDVDAAFGVAMSRGGYRTAPLTELP